MRLRATGAKGRIAEIRSGRAVVEAGGWTVSLGDLLGPRFAAEPHRMFGWDRFPRWLHVTAAICVAVAVYVDSFNFPGMTEEEFTRAMLVNVLLPIVLGLWISLTVITAVVPEMSGEIYGHYWKGTIPEYCEMYDATVAAVRRVLPSARVGGPHTCGAHKNEKAQTFLRAFLKHASDTGVPLDFVGFHAKGQPSVHEGRVGGTVDRDGLWAVTSPVVLPADVVAELDAWPDADDFTALVSWLRQRFEVRFLEAPALGRRVEDESSVALLEALAAG